MRSFVAIVLVMAISDVEEVLLAATRLGLADGQRAFILMDTSTALNASLQLAMSTPFTLNTTSLDLTTAAHALLIIKAHAVSLANVSATYKVVYATHTYKHSPVYDAARWLSVRLSQAGVLSKRLKGSSCFSEQRLSTVDSFYCETLC